MGRKPSGARMEGAKAFAAWEPPRNASHRAARQARHAELLELRQQHRDNRGVVVTRRAPLQAPSPAETEPAPSATPSTAPTPAPAAAPKRKGLLGRLGFSAPPGQPLGPLPGQPPAAAPAAAAAPVPAPEAAPSF